MNNLKNKFNKLSKNRLVFTETSTIQESSDNVKNNDSKNKPTGGFPPIFIVNDDDRSLSKQKFNLNSNIKEIDIKDLINKKKNNNDLFI